MIRRLSRLRRGAIGAWSRRSRPALIANERGATIVEFAVVAPVMGVLLLGAFDIAHTLYLRATLQGIVQKVARDSTLETGLASEQQNALDTRVRSQVKALANNAAITITRTSFYDYSDAARVGLLEPYDDVNQNGFCDPPASANDPGEKYEDQNNSGTRDAITGTNGQGGAKDTVLYKVSVSYPRFFPIYRIIGGSDTTSVSASTVLRNQPYGDQAQPTLRTCTVKQP